MANDYKKDAGKVPLLSALQPFAPALYALARMMEDMKHKHQLAGSSDPFSQWAELPAAKRRMSEALERHLLPEDEGATLWSVNTKDGSHLHATHALFNLLGALTLHIRDNADRCCGAPDAEYVAISTGAGVPPPQATNGPAQMIHGPAGADWREKLQATRCMSISAGGSRCEYLEGHQGLHVKGLLTWGGK